MVEVLVEDVEELLDEPLDRDEVVLVSPLAVVDVASTTVEVDDEEVDDEEVDDEEFDDELMNGN